MKLVTINRSEMTDERCADIMRTIAVALMDHGKVTLETGTAESAASHLRNERNEK